MGVGGGREEFCQSFEQLYDFCKRKDLEVVWDFSALASLLMLHTMFQGEGTPVGSSAWMQHWWEWVGNLPQYRIRV